MTDSHTDNAGDVLFIIGLLAGIALALLICTGAMLVGLLPLQSLAVAIFVMAVILWPENPITGPSRSSPHTLVGPGDGYFREIH